MDKEKTQNKRWYDLDPTVSLAVNMLETSDSSIKAACADFIVEEAKNRGFALEFEDKNSFNYLWKRWQDSDKKMFEALEYFKIIDFESKKQLSLEIINYIREYEEKYKK